MCDSRTCKVVVKAFCKLNILSIFATNGNRIEAATYRVSIWQLSQSILNIQLLYIHINLNINPYPFTNVNYISFRFNY